MPEAGQAIALASLDRRAPHMQGSTALVRRRFLPFPVDEPLADDLSGRIAPTTPRRLSRTAIEVIVRAAADGGRAVALLEIVVEPRPRRRRAGFGSSS